eukprot:CAMPEP_0170549910 /NCGR_PEP_ID=MMETSP0211-20121228/8008_1 /TAXON_ID=311385 /ORGANISM="Pseudokeronopsis sp., Strain OXSARD2" /LENGTH=108 /DNA_ID=CAMNT_0010856161 /DNA_START=230 /DNA_END=556 /DNA_ORIENTATION=-
MTYQATISISGESLPSFMSFDGVNRELSIYTDDTSYAGTYHLTLSGLLDIWDAVTYEITVNVEELVYEFSIEDFEVQVGELLFYSLPVVNVQIDQSTEALSYIFEDLP